MIVSGSQLFALSPSRRIALAVAGVNGRGLELISQFTSLPQVVVKYVIDVDRKPIPKAVKRVQARQQETVRTETDFRRVLEDRDVEALVIATPDHWHAPMAIAAVQAGKHVYVEKPCSHNPREGEMLVEVAGKHNRLVQMGNQRRSVEDARRLVQEIREGVIGNVYLSQCFYSRRRRPIGFGKVVRPPEGLDWELWQGPAPRTDFRSNVHPYNWHWFWRWGTGEALNNGVHMLDVARWAMNVTYPSKVSSFGGRWHDVGLDDWECPDTQEIAFEFEGGRGISWFGRSTNTFGPGSKANGIIFYGNKGIIDYDGGRVYTLYDLDNKVVRASGVLDGSKGVELANGIDPGLKDTHASNFIAAIRGDEKLNSPIAEGHISTTLGHLGNIAHRVGRSLRTNPQDGHILGDAEAQKLWSRDYEPGWSPKT